MATPKQSNNNFDPTQYGAVPVEEFDPTKLGAIPVQQEATQPTSSIDTAASRATGISAAPTGVAGWLQQLEGDVRHGTGQTLPGRILQKVGAPGLEAGVPKGVSDFMGSPELGAIHGAQANVEAASGHPLSGMLHGAQAGLEAMQIPMMMTGGEALPVVEKNMPTAIAKRGFQLTEKVAGSMPLDLSETSNQALRAQEISERGANLPKVVKDYLDRITKPEATPLTFKEARDYYTNATKLSSEDIKSMSGPMKRQVAMFTKSLGDSLIQTAKAAGVGDDYTRAMAIYHGVSIAKRFAGIAIPTVAGGVAGYDILKRFGVLP